MIIAGIAGIFLFIIAFEVYKESGVVMGIISHFFSLFFIYFGFKRFKALNFFDDRLQYYDIGDINNEPVTIYYNQIIGISIQGNKIYLQSSSSNITIKKKLFTSDNFDMIINEFMKIQKKYNIK